MLILVTGLPGAGKTSNTLWDFLNSPEYANRPRFASDIADFDHAKHGVGELEDLTAWQDLPDGSVVLVDEAQRFLRPRSSRQVPDWLGAFETHRHRGMDFIFITQSPALIDTHVRRLIGRHIHYNRPFGLSRAARYTWEYCEESPGPNTFKHAQRQVIKANPAVFSLYKSTVQDTHKASLPWRKLAIIALLLPLSLAGLAYPFIWAKSVKDKTAPAATAPTPALPGQPVATGSPYVDPAKTALDGQRTFTPSDLVPRIRSMPWTAPFYDAITQPTDFPRLAACVASATRCQCFSQQATPLDTDDSTCRQIVKSGVFDAWITGRRQADSDDDTKRRADVPAQPERGPVEREESVSVTSSNPGSRTFDTLGVSGFDAGRG